MTITPKQQTDVQVNVTIPYGHNDEVRVKIEHENGLVTLSTENNRIVVQKGALDEALRVLGYKPGPVYRNSEAGQAQRAAARVPGFDEHVGDCFV